MELPSLNLEDDAIKTKVINVLSSLYIDDSTCKKLITVFEDEIEKGMKHGLQTSSLQMENTFIPELLDGSENGQYLALDLGGTNFRVIKLQLEKGKIVDEIIEYYQVEEHLRLGKGTNLFEFLAECIKDFIQKNNLSREKSLPLGFTFSFPMTQKALDIALLVNWTKSFNCPGVIGEDVVSMLNSSLKKVGVTNVNVVAILNDTTGTLVAGSHDFPNTAVGLILGTGTNASYIERAERVSRWGEGDIGIHEGRVIIDPEMGAFGDNGCIDFIRTQWDKEMDRRSLLPGSFTFEKYFSGKYLGELVRLAFVSALEVMGDEVPYQLTGFESLSTADVSEIVRKAVDKESEIPRVLSSLTMNQAAVMEYVCQMFSERAALLVSLTIATFLNRMNLKTESVIAVTGSLYKHHPTLSLRLSQHTSRLTTLPFTYRLSDDGSGKGAGLVAAIATRIHKL